MILGRVICYDPRVLSGRKPSAERVARSDPERATPKTRHLDYRAGKGMLELLGGEQNEQEDLIEYIDLQHDALMTCLQFHQLSLHTAIEILLSLSS